MPDGNIFIVFWSNEAVCFESGREMSLEGEG
jgi:hypothetical protein